jgi:glycosyltransferase involved in cell wall biosynthesis
MRKIRILHCPDIVGGNPPSLARAERELGLDSWSISVHPSIFDYHCDEVLLKPSDNGRDYVRAIWRLFWKGLHGYHFIHYNFGSTIFPAHVTSNPNSSRLWKSFGKPLFTFLRMIDLPVFHALGKGIAVTFQGDDARQGDFSLQNFKISIAQFVDTNYYEPKTDAEKRRKIALFDRLADLIYYMNPDLGHILPARAKFLPYAHIDLREWKVIPPIEKQRPLVVHAPSQRGVKGTDVIVQTVECLKRNGVDFDFELVEGFPNTEARKVYERADLLIDQLYAGWYGGVSVEFMALGKPVICYVRESDLKFIPEKMRQELPVINATAETLYDILKHWLHEKAARLEVGERGRAYAEKWHDPLTIAAILKKDYESVLSKKPLYRFRRQVRSSYHVEE